MRLENYNVASFEDVGVADEPMAATAAPAVEPAPEPEAPSTLLSEMAQQPPVVTLTPPPAPVPPEARLADTPRQQPGAEDADARVKPLANAAEAPAAPSWQGMSLPSAAPSPGPGIDAATFARIEAMGSRDSSAGGSRGGGFGGFGAGGFGGGNETETWDYSYSGVDGAPDVNISVTYQGDTPVSSMTTTTLSDSGSSVSFIPQEVITLPTPTGISDLAADVPPTVDPAGVSTGVSAAPNTSAAPGMEGGGTAASPAPQNASSAAAPTNDTPPQNTPPSAGPSQANVIAKNQDGQDIRVVGRYQQQGNIQAVDNAPILLAGHPALPADATGATPMRDNDGKGTLLYRIEGGSSNGDIRQLLPAASDGPAQQLVVEQLERTVVTGSRNPNAGADDAPDHGAALPAQASLSSTAATLALTAASADRLAAVNGWLLSTGRAVVATLAEATVAVAEALEGLEAGTVLVGELALVAVAAGINLVLIPPSRDQITQLGDNQRFVTRPGERLGTLQQRGADGEWQDVKSGVALYATGQQRVALTDEEARRLQQPAINVPAPPQPPLEGLVPPPKDDNLNMLPGAPVAGPQLPTVETLPIAAPPTIDDHILTRDGRDAKELGNNLTAAGKPMPGPGYQPHHAVPVAAGGADMQAVRDKLKSFGIDINDAVNGVWLPGPKSDPNAPEAYHPRLNNADYNLAIVTEFQSVTTREGAINALNDIGSLLQEGNYPGVRPRPGSKGTPE